jgi:hypothetical protein
MAGTGESAIDAYNEDAGSSECYGETREEVLEDIENWGENRDDGANVFSGSRLILASPLSMSDCFNRKLSRMIWYSRRIS